jgi:putative ABC transport system permease protein
VFDSLRLALRDGWRALAASRGTTLVTILTLAIGLAGATALFTIVYGVLLKPLPFAEPDRLVVVWETRRDEGTLENVVSPANYLEWRDTNRVFSGLGAVSMTFRAMLTGGGQRPASLPIQLVTHDVLSILGVRPALGRNFLPEEDRRRSDAVLISYRLWQQRYASSPGIVGRTITIDGQPRRVVGVLPRGFSLLDDTPDLWLPIGFDAESRTPKGRWIAVVGRLRPRVTLARAQANMDVVAAALERKFPAFDTHWGANVVPIEEQVVGGARRPLLLVGLAALMLLVIACANVTGLLLARAGARTREMATRIALGATRGQLVRQALVEAALVSSAAGAVGLGLAYALLRAFSLLAGDTHAIPRLEWVALDTPTFAAALAMIAVTAFTVGVAPAFASARSDVAQALASGTRSHTAPAASRLRRGLVAFEVALAILLLVGAGLLTRTVNHLLTTNPGFDRTSVLTFQVSLPPWKYDAPAKVAAAFDRLLAEFGSEPGVKRIGAVNTLPMSGDGPATAYTIAGRPAPAAGMEPVAGIRIVAGDYFASLRVPLVAGRLFSRSERADAHVILVNESLAREAWPGESAIGQRVRIAWRDEDPNVVVGVVGDFKAERPDEPAKPTIYFPHVFDPWPGMTITVRTAVDPATLATAMERRLSMVDPDAVFAAARSMDDVVARSIALRTLTMRLAVGFAIAAVLLAGVGLFALLAFTVAVRRREIGIRAALGARGRDITRWVVGQSLRATVPGMAAGLVLAWAGAGYLRDLLFGIGVHDALTFGAVIIVVAAVTLVAAWLPARTATKVQTSELLRAE